MSDIIVTQNDHVLELTLDRPKKKNALSFAMYEALAEALQSAQKNPAVRVVLLHATGDSFCSGNDINDFLSGTNLDPTTAPTIRFIEALVALDKPLVAAVQGAAVGIGTTMLLHADLVYAHESARFSVPFVGLGLVPEAASSLLLPRRVGPAAASDLLLRGTVIDAVRAAAIGLVNEVVRAPADLLAVARERANDVAAKPPRAVRLTKALTRSPQAEVLARVHEEAKHFADRLTSDEAREAFTAFIERRPANFANFS
ncbi:enoyl-CoA hydratase [Pendulispora rubella]|uniref:Enoyl-CoA hydratase n=1 Tax=Pendulispora rubella TaxID=2741070 RepID=A0ABZ2KZI2_9BACT